MGEATEDEILRVILGGLQVKAEVERERDGKDG
jgi:hypothetical protein